MVVSHHPLTADSLRKSLVSVCDRLVDAADGAGGFIPSVMGLDEGGRLYKLPRAISGQRDNDRAFPGSNLLHDFPTLAAFDALSAFTGDDRYAAATDRYLRRFMETCTRTTSGLFLWGEHAFWNIVDECPGNGSMLKHVAGPLTHDHLRQVPRWLWQRLWEMDAGVCGRFCRGLDGHWVDEGRSEYNRHAPIAGRSGRGGGARSCDFPRHAGFYVFDLAIGLARTQREELAEEAERFAAYWWRVGGGEMLLSESRTPMEERAEHGLRSARQTLSLGVSLLESAAVVEASHPELAAAWRERGEAWVGAYLALPHEARAGRLVATLARESDEVLGHQALWGSGYGQNGTAAVDGMLCLTASRHIKDARLLTLAADLGRAYAEQPSAMPSEHPVPVKDPGQTLGLLVELYHTTGEAAWLDAAARVAAEAVRLYLDSPLPRAATGLDYYESQLMPGYLLHALTRLLLTIDGAPADLLDADATQR